MTRLWNWTRGTNFSPKYVSVAKLGLSNETARRHGPDKAQVRGTQLILNSTIYHNKPRSLVTPPGGFADKDQLCDRFDTVIGIRDFPRDEASCIM